MEEKNDNENVQNESVPDNNTPAPQLGELKKPLESIIDQSHKNAEVLDFMLKTLKDIHSETAKHTPALEGAVLKEQLDKLKDVIAEQKDEREKMYGISKEMKDVLEELRKAFKENDEEKISNQKEILIRLDAVIESISVVQESNEHIKNISNAITDTNSIIEHKLDGFSESLEFQTKEITDKIEQLVNSNQEFLDKTFGKFEEFGKTFADIAQKTNELVEYEKSINEKREKEFSKTQAKILNERGMVLFYRGIFSSSLDNFFKALEYDPESPEILNNIGQTYSRMNESDKAEEYFKKAIEVFPDFSECFNNLSLLYMNNDKYELAVENLKKAVDMFPDFADAYINLGNAYKAMNKTSEAISSWNKALEINPFNEDAKENLKLYKEGDIDV